MQDEEIRIEEGAALGHQVEGFIFYESAVFYGGASGEHGGTRPCVADGVDHGAKAHGFCFAAHCLNLFVGHALVAART